MTLTFVPTPLDLVEVEVPLGRHRRRHLQSPTNSTNADRFPL